MDKEGEGKMPTNKMEKIEKYKRGRRRLLGSLPCGFG
jgi:hypothetical protein